MMPPILSAGSTSNDYAKIFVKSTLIKLSNIQITLCFLAFTTQIVILAAGEGWRYDYGYLVYGISGIWFGVSGCFGIWAGTRSSTSSIIIMMVMSIGLTVAVCIIQMLVSVSLLYNFI